MVFFLKKIKKIDNNQNKYIQVDVKMHRQGEREKKKTILVDVESEWIKREADAKKKKSCAWFGH